MADQSDAKLLSEALSDLRDALATWVQNGGSPWWTMAHTLEAVRQASPVMARRLPEAVSKRAWRGVRGQPVSAEVSYDG